MRRRLAAVVITTSVLLGGGMAAGLATPANARSQPALLKCTAESTAVIRAQVLVAVALGDTAKAQAQLRAAVAAHAACVARV